MKKIRKLSYLERFFLTNLRCHFAINPEISLNSNLAEKIIRGVGTSEPYSEKILRWKMKT